MACLLIIDDRAGRALAVNVARFDLAVDPTWRLAGGLGNAAAILVFLAVAVPRLERC